MYTAVKRNFTGKPSHIKHGFEERTQLSSHDARISYHPESSPHINTASGTGKAGTFIAPMAAKQFSLNESVRPLPIASRPEGVIQLCPQNNQNLYGRLAPLMNTGKFGHLSANEKITIAELAIHQASVGENTGDDELFNAALRIAEDIAFICLNPSPEIKEEKLNLLKKASGLMVFNDIISMLKGEAEGSKLVFQGKDGNPKNNTLCNVQDILNQLTNPDYKEKALQLIDELLPLTTPGGILSVLKGANMNVSDPILDGIIDSKNTGWGQDAFISRLSLMVKYIKDVAEEQDDSSDTRSRIRDTYYIESTGSDPHKNGMHALFLIDKKSKKRFLYKPRLLNTDRAVSGPKGVMKVLSSSGKIEPLPSMEFQGAHKEELVRRIGATEADAVPLKTAKMFCRKLGEMQAIAEICGITDLHTENIIFTKLGPIIIDAECSFIDYGGTLLNSMDGPLDRIENSDRTDAAPSLFYYKGKWARIYKSTSIKLVSGKNTDANPEAAALKNEFYEGEKEMLIELNKMVSENKLSEKLDPALADLNHIRLVPIKTQDFAGFLASYIKAKQDKNSKACSGLPTYMAELICNKLLEKKWLFSDPNAGSLKFVDKADIISNTVQAAFEQGTIPAFYMDYDKSEKFSKSKSQEIWQIKMDGVCIAHVYWKKSLKTQIKKRIKENILSKNIKETLQRSSHIGAAAIMSFMGLFLLLMAFIFYLFH